MEGPLTAHGAEARASVEPEPGSSKSTKSCPEPEGPSEEML